MGSVSSTSQIWKKSNILDFNKKSSQMIHIVTADFLHFTTKLFENLINKVFLKIMFWLVPSYTKWCDMDKIEYIFYPISWSTVSF